MFYFPLYEQQETITLKKILEDYTSTPEGRAQQAVEVTMDSVKPLGEWSLIYRLFRRLKHGIISVVTLLDYLF